MRAFIAIDLPEPIQIGLAQQQAAFRSALAAGPRRDEGRWTRPDGIHLTLKFLGEISDDQAGRISETLAALGPFEKFTVEVKGFGFFPDARRPRVFWAGVVAPPALGQLAEQVEGCAEKLGFTRENHPFAPHLTLARFKVPKPQPALQSILEREGEKVLGRFEVSEFFLFESRLSPQGAKYLKVARFPRS